MAHYTLKKPFRDLTTKMPVGTPARDLTLAELTQEMELEGHLTVMQNIADGFWPVMCMGHVRYFSREKDLQVES